MFVANLKTIFVCFAIFLLSTPAVEVNATFHGVTGSSCKSDDDCRGSRSCVGPTTDLGQPSLCDPTQSNICICFQDERCIKSTDCDRGEMCYNIPSAGLNSCSSCDFVPLNDPRLQPVDDTAICEGFYNNHGVSFDFCKISATCKMPRNCISPDDRSECDGSQLETCFCFSDSDPRSCLSDSSCETNEICVFLQREEGPSDPFCASDYLPGNTTTVFPYDPDNSPAPDRSSPVPSSQPPRISPVSSAKPRASNIPKTSESSSADNPPQASQSSNTEPSQSSNPKPSGSLTSSINPFFPDPTVTPPPCIAIHHLTHLRNTHLVFKSHRRAPVLCDSSGSCATAAHIIVHNAEPMSMRAYCGRLSEGCRRQVMWVNSVKMGAGVRVRSFSEGMLFTAFAAKFETWLEERVLVSLVRLGL